MLWLNLMLGVFRSLTNKAAEATTQILEKQAIDKAFNDSVYPFNSIGEITFDGAFFYSWVCFCANYHDDDTSLEILSQDINQLVTEY